MTKPDWMPSLPPPQPWMEDAACANTDPEVFFMVGTTPELMDATRQAKRVCRSCSVQAECLAYALTVDDRHGIWGGTTPWERRAMKRGLA
jgi:WhiB family redox-sensing transcriptional regulator